MIQKIKELNAIQLSRLVSCKMDLQMSQIGIPAETRSQPRSGLFVLTCVK